MKKVISVVGARPNFIKIAPIHKAFKKFPKIGHKICHTGQHFDKKMSEVFFNELDLPLPDFNLDVRSGSHAVQTAKIMIEFEKVLLAENPDMIIVPGDVNSTMACSLVASKMGIKIAHVESGLRSFDRSMPEEINRIVTDTISDLLFVSEPSGLKNLKNEGIQEKKIHFTGNVMIDSLLQYMPKIQQSEYYRQLGVSPNKYILVTFHRPANVDHEEGLSDLVKYLNIWSSDIKVIFPVHPRTMGKLREYKLIEKFKKNIIITDPIGYIDFLSLIKSAFMVITDSGGIQEETTFLSVPCVTVRDNTERPVTVEKGTNFLAGTNLINVTSKVQMIFKGKLKKGTIPDFWDGKTAERITDIIDNYLQ